MTDDCFKTKARTTEKVIEKHLAAVGSGDVDEVLKNYATDATLMSSDQIYSGHDEIREFLAAVIEEFTGPNFSFEICAKSVAGAIAYLVWTAEAANKVIELGTDTFFIESGVIVAQTATTVVRIK